MPLLIRVSKPTNFSVTTHDSYFSEPFPIDKRMSKICGSIAARCHMPISPELEAVHRLIIECHREYFGESPSINKVQKLCYYAEGFCLAEGHSLFPEDFEAWQRGPGIPNLQAKYQELEWRVIEVVWDSPLEEARGFQLVRELVASYGRYDGAELSAMTHEEPPWKNARGDIPESHGSRALISKSAMRNYFCTQIFHHEDQSL